MPAVSRAQAVDLLTRAVEEQLPPDELLEIHNELFPDDACTAEEARNDPIRITQRLVGFINGGRDPSELPGLWGLVFTKDRNIWYNEEEDRVHYNEETEALGTE